MLHDLIIDGMVIESIETEQPYSDASVLGGSRVHSPVAFTRESGS
jgi:hypothetical protein